MDLWISIYGFLGIRVHLKFSRIYILYQIKSRFFIEYFFRGRFSSNDTYTIKLNIKVVLHTLYSSRGNSLCANYIILKFKHLFQVSLAGFRSITYTLLTFIDMFLLQPWPVVDMLPMAFSRCYVVTTCIILTRLSIVLLHDSLVLICVTYFCMF